MNTPLKIALASSEVAPFAKTGGLADVSGALPKYLTRLGCDVKVFMPKYVSVDDSKWDLHYCADIGEILIRMGRVTRSAHV
ncbi:MAG TPA: glycogen/starch synthase, partial [bacterium]|nr:glycogen/starch synthase [bacterium]